MILASALLAALAAGEIRPGRAQTPSSAEQAPAELPRKRKLRLGPVGYLSLPEGYQAYRTEDLRDAWYGYIVSADKKIRINWSSGLVRTPFDDGEDKFVWVRREGIKNGVLAYGLRRTAEGDLIAASVGWVNLYMTVESESGLNTFLEIARSYKVEQCEDCERPLPAPPPDNGTQPKRN